MNECRTDVRKILLSSFSKTSKVSCELRENFIYHSVRVKLGCLQRLSSMDSIYYLVGFLSKILSLISNTEDECFHFASIYVYEENLFLLRADSSDMPILR